MRNFEKTIRTTKQSFGEDYNQKGRKLNKTQRGCSSKRMWQEVE